MSGLVIFEAHGFYDIHSPPKVDDDGESYWVFESRDVRIPPILAYSASDPHGSNCRAFHIRVHPDL